MNEPGPAFGAGRCTAPNAIVAIDDPVSPIQKAVSFFFSLNAQTYYVLVLCRSLRALRDREQRLGLRLDRYPTYACL